MGARKCGCQCHMKSTKELKLNRAPCPSDSDDDEYFSATEVQPTPEASPTLTKEQDLKPTKQGTTAQVFNADASLAMYKALLGRFFWLREPREQYFNVGLSKAASAHPFLVVNVKIEGGDQDDTSKVLFGVCMINAFSKYTRQDAIQLASRDDSLVPIWPNTPNANVTPPLAFLRDTKEKLPRASWINGREIRYIKADCFNLGGKGSVSKVQLGLESVNAMRKKLSLPTVGCFEIPQALWQQLMSMIARQRSTSAPALFYQLTQVESRSNWVKEVQDNPVALLGHPVWHLILAQAYQYGLQP